MAHSDRAQLEDALKSKNDDFRLAYHLALTFASGSGPNVTSEGIMALFDAAMTRFPSEGKFPQHG